MYQITSKNAFCPFTSMQKYCILIITEVGQTDKSKLKTILRRSVIVAVWALALVFCIKNRHRFTFDGVLEFTPSNPVLAAVIMLGLFALKSVNAVIYCGLLYAVSGIIFPLPSAAAINLAGTVIMSSIPYFIGKSEGYGAVKEFLKKHSKFEKIKEFRTENEFMLIFLSRAVGILPADIMSLYFGACNTPFWKFILASGLGLLPRIIGDPIIGRKITDPASPEFIISLSVNIAFTLVSILVYYIRRKKNGT